MLYAIILKFGLPQAQHKPNFKTTHIASRYSQYELIQGYIPKC